MRRARGFTLIETLVVIGLTATFLAGTTAVLHLLFRSERTVRDGIERRHSTALIAEQLRRDAHAAQSAELSAGPAGPASILQLQLGDARTVTYSVADQHVERVARERDTIVQRETFPLRTQVRATWRMPPGGQHPLVEFEIATQDRTWTIRASVGRL